MCMHTGLVAFLLTIRQIILYMKRIIACEFMDTQPLVLCLALVQNCARIEDSGSAGTNTPSRVSALLLTPTS